MSFGFAHANLNKQDCCHTSINEYGVAFDNQHYLEFQTKYKFTLTLLKYRMLNMDMNNEPNRSNIQYSKNEGSGIILDKKLEAKKAKIYHTS